MRMILKEGRKRQIRQMVEAVGHSVERLVRVRMGNLVLGKLASGKGRWLNSQEVRSLRRFAGLRKD